MTSPGMFTHHILTPFLSILTTYPSNNAFFISGNYHTYTQFSKRISAIRTHIQNAPIDEQIWGLRIQDNINTYASIFALWLEGKAYVPLHPTWPEDRLNDIQRQVGFSNILDNCDVPYISDNLLNPKQVSDNQLAYILFTSGSTGTPKGVQITRGNIAAFMDSFWQTGIRIDQTDRCMQLFDLTFDVSVQSYLVALTRGACLYTVPYGQVKYLYAASLIQEHRITFGAMAPSMLTYLRPYFDEFDASSMKTCILTAEACPIDLIEAWYKCARNCTVYDFYGPTEATIYCTYYPLSRTSPIPTHNGIVSIGHPLANVTALLVTENGKVGTVPLYQNSCHQSPANSVSAEPCLKGELCVAGPQITPGYWNNPEKNAAAFFEHDGQRYYRTGDLCYLDPSGNIMYAGRIDQQAKIQGFRVELGEIEHHARQFFNNDKRCVAIAFQNSQNLTEIALFIETPDTENHQLSTTNYQLSTTNHQPLITYLKSKMPQYMIPSRIITLPAFPLNKSEKIDRPALKSLL